MILYPLPGELYVDFHRRLKEATEKAGGIPADPDWMGGDTEESRAFCGQDEMGRFTYGNDCGDEDGIPDGAKQRTPTKAGKKGGGKKAAPKLEQPEVERPGLPKEDRWQPGNSLRDVHQEVIEGKVTVRSPDGKKIESTQIPDAYKSPFAGREFISGTQVAEFLCKKNDEERGRIITTTAPLGERDFEYMASSIANEVQKAMDRGVGHVFYSPEEQKKQLDSYAKVQPLIFGGKTASGVDLDPETTRFMWNAMIAITSVGATPRENVTRTDQILTPIFNDSDPANTRIPHPRAKMSGTAGPGIIRSMGRMQKIVDKLGEGDQAAGWKKMAELFDGPPMRAGDLTKFFNKLGIEGKWAPSGTAVDDIVPRFSVFGPKVGAYFANNRGTEENGGWDFVTADLWWSRTWGRASGEVMQQQSLSLASDHGKALDKMVKKIKDGELGSIDRETFAADAKHMAKTGTIPASIEAWAEEKLKAYSGMSFKAPTDRETNMYRLAKVICANTVSTIAAPKGARMRTNMGAVAREVSKRVGIPVAFLQDVLWQNEQDMWGTLGARTTTAPGVPSILSTRVEQIVSGEIVRRKPWETSGQIDDEEDRSSNNLDDEYGRQDFGAIEQLLFEADMAEVSDDDFVNAFLETMTVDSDKESRSACEKQADGKFATGNDCAAGDGLPIDRTWKKSDEQLVWDSESLSSSPPAKSLASARAVLIPAGRTLGKSLRILGVSMDDVVKVGGSSGPDSDVVIGHGDMKNLMNLVDGEGEVESEPSGMVTILGKRDVMGIKSAVSAGVTIWRDAEDEDKLKVFYEFIGVSPEAQEKASIAVGRGMMKGVVDSITSAAKMGADEVTMFAAGNERHKEFKGYRIWPRVGFDGVIPRNLITHTWTLQRGFFNSYGSEIPREALSPQAKKEIASGKLTIQALYETPAGQKWWESHGGPMEMKFKPGEKSSPGWKRFVKYRDRLSSRSLDDLWEAFCGESDLESRAFCPTGKDGGVNNSCGSEGVSGPLKGWGKTDKTERYTPDEKSFSGSKYINEIKIDEPKKVREVLDAVKMTLSEAIQASGSPGEAIAKAGGKPIKIAMAREGSGVTIDWSVEGGGAEATRHISPDGKGGVRLGMGGFFIDSPELRGKGIALDALARSISNPSVSILYMSAERFDTPGPMMMIGYKHWPKYGFNAPISLVEKVTKKSGGVPKQFSKCKDLLDVYATPGGPEWWAENGSSIHLDFDNRQRSKSRDVLLKVIRDSRDKFGGG